MNQFDALVVVLGVCVLAGLVVAFFPASLSPFKSRSAMVHFGSAIGILFFNLLPVFLDGVLVNKLGEEISFVALLLATLIPASLFFILAVRAERAERK